MSYLTSTTQSYQPKPRTTAMGVAILLHVGLIVAIGGGLTPPKPVSLPTDLNIAVIDPPDIPAPKPNLDPVIKLQPPFTITPTDVLLPPIADAGHSITQTKPPPEDTSSGVAPQRVITPPSEDARHPLTQPMYPATSRRAGEEGTVELMLYVLPNGRVIEARVAKSSGFARLDKSALREAARRWRFKPQTVDGVAVAAWHKISVTFRLEN